MGKKADWARTVRPIFQSVSQPLPDAQALKVRGIYDPWTPNTAYGGPNEPQIVRFGDGLYRVRQPHTSQIGWEPDKYPAGWQRIDMEHSGTREDPIPAALNMAYCKGKYYTEGGKLYLCTRDTGDPVSYLPSQLVGQYFEEVSP